MKSNSFLEKCTSDRQESSQWFLCGLESKVKMKLTCHKIVPYLSQVLAQFLVIQVFLASASSVEDISIKTLPPDYARPVLESADALLSDWEGEHWASLDADLDKVALSWTTTQTEAIFQVR